MASKSKVITKSIELAGRTLSLEIGRLAQQATSSVLARYGDSVVLATATLGKVDNKKDYFPLSVEYQERLYAGGRIKGSRWVKREGRPTDAEVLSGRLIDRSIRPLFPKNYKNEVQVIVTVLATDLVNDTDILGTVAASAALAISPIPWAGPVGAVRVGLVEGKLVANPLNGNETGVDLDLVVTSTESLIDMIEAGAKQVPEDTFVKALELGVDHNKQVIAFINELVAEVNPTKLPVPVSEVAPAIVADIEKQIAAPVAEYISTYSTKEGGNLDDIVSTVTAGIEDADVKAAVPAIVEEYLHKTIRKNILDKAARPDGRKVDEIRPLSIEVGVLPRVHGSAIFQRGQTQALTITTLGAPSLSQSLESAEGEETKRYLHHYNFPPFSTGETGRIGSPGRREIGHGALAEKALMPVIPSEQDFPYTLRLVSEILSSNGSTSMASTCGSCLSLMDAGVPITAPVAGISTGLIVSDEYPKKTDKYVLLTDIIGMEDHHGDMDFKVAGTEAGVTAIQLDVKIPGITLDMCRETFTRARAARMEILAAMKKVIDAPRPELSPLAPKIHSTQIPVDKIGELIGPGGKNIKKLMADTVTDIDVRDDGSVFVTGTDLEGVNTAISWISSLGKEVVPGEIYDGTVARIQPFGAFVNILPGKDGLVHVSQMAQGYVSDPGQIVQEGQAVKVWVIEIDSQGRINLSMLFDESGKPAIKAVENRPPSRDNFSGPRSGRDQGRGGDSRRRF